MQSTSPAEFLQTRQLPFLSRPSATPGTAKLAPAGAGIVETEDTFCRRSFSRGQQTIHTINQSFTIE